MLVDVKSAGAGARFSCFTGTKVQILTKRKALVVNKCAGANGKLDLLGLLVLYWYKIQILTQKAVVDVKRAGAVDVKSGGKSSSDLIRYTCQ